MSYCVNCGVELDASEKNCPLCGLEVQNPRQPYSPAAKRPYAQRLDPVYSRINRHFVASILTIATAFPALLCLVINMILAGKFSWSLYVAGALAVVWVFVVPRFIIRKLSFMRLFIPDLIAVILYLLLLELLTPVNGWFVPLAMPIALLVGCFALINGLLINHRILKESAIPAALLASAGLVNVGIEIIVELYLHSAFVLDWSLFVLIPCLAVAAFFATIARRQAIREEIKKRLHL